MRQCLPIVASFFIAVATLAACAAREPASPSLSPGAAPTASTSAPAAGDPADPALESAMRALADKSAPGMTAEGEARYSTLAEGASLETQVILEPRRCYTLVAMSAPQTISELDVHLRAPAIPNVMAWGAGTTKGNPVVLGGSTPMCNGSPNPLAYTAIVTAKKGAGRILLRVYAKAE